MSIKIGYARVSTSRQNFDLQLDALNASGCVHIYTDCVQGTTWTREGFQEALRMLDSGDTLVVWKLDRLARSLPLLWRAVEKLTAMGVHLKSVTEEIDTTTPRGRMFISTLGLISSIERKLTTERTLAGLAAAKRRGRVGGRRPKMTQDKTQKAQILLDAGKPYKEVARALEVSIATLYRHCPAAEGE